MYSCHGVYKLNQHTMTGAPTVKISDIEFQWTMPSVMVQFIQIIYFMWFRSGISGISSGINIYIYKLIN